MVPSLPHRTRRHPPGDRDPHVSRHSALDAVVLLYDDEQGWAANTTQFWYIADAHRDGTLVLAFASAMPQLVCT